MALHLVLLTVILAFSLASTEQCVSSPDSSIDLSLHSMKNASGHWIITIDIQRLSMKENLQELSVDVHQETRICGGYQTEQLFSISFVYPSLYGTSMPGAIEHSTTRPTTTTTATPSTSTSTTATPSTPTTSSSTTTTAKPSTTSTTTYTTTPKSCPHSGYQLYPGFNCYKAFPSEGERKTWSEAREQCMRDGGDLMVMETERERDDVYIPLYNSVERWSNYSPWVGVYTPQGEGGWKTVKGEPFLSTWWWPGDPDTYADGKCAYAIPNSLLMNYDCAYRLPFICEISL